MIKQPEVEPIFPFGAHLSNEFKSRGHDLYVYQRAVFNQERKVEEEKVRLRKEIERFRQQVAKRCGVEDGEKINFSNVACTNSLLASCAYYKGKCLFCGNLEDDIL